MTNYPRDEFDNIPETSSRQGVHRTAMGQPRSGLWPIVAFAVVALVIGALAFFIVPKLMDHKAPAASGSSSSAAASKSAGPTSSAAAPTSAAPSTSSAPSPTTPPTSEAPKIDKTQPVGVFNASGVTGLAAKVAGQVTGQGWNVSQTGNWTGNAVASSVVYYQNDAAKAGAEDIAKQLGIADVVQAQQAALPIMVVLGPGAQ